MKDFRQIAGDIAQDAVRFAERSGITLDYTRESIEDVETLLGALHENLDRFEGDSGAKTLWNSAVMFGTYIGETLLRCGFADKGFAWVEDDGMPILRHCEKETAVSPITKAHKRILNGPEDSVKSFVDVAFTVADGGWPAQGVLQVLDVETASGEKTKQVLFSESDHYISLVAEGKEDFVIFTAPTGFFQFYGVGDQFVCEAWFNLNGQRAFAIINPDCANTERVTLTTPFGQYTPRERDIISLAQLKQAMRAYFANVEEADFLASVPHEKIDSIS